VRLTFAREEMDLFNVDFANLSGASESVGNTTDELAG
jgi:hypothetical protein